MNLNHLLFFNSYFRGILATALLLLVAGHSVADPKRGLAPVLESIRSKYNLPSLSGAIFTTDGVREMAAVGVRKAGTSVPVTTDDLWHLGSDTKAMTALLVGAFVAEKKLSWSDKVISFFPEIAGKVPAGVRNITVDQVLRHEAGLAAADDSRYMTKLASSLSGSLTEQRLQAAHLALISPEYHPGTFHYSNNDYVVIAAILEKTGDRPWEAFMRERIFQPLGMTKADFGGTGTVGQIDQPWPHLSSGVPAPTNGPTMDLPPLWGPAGSVHCTMGDWAKFLVDQLRGGEGTKALLPEEIYRAMQTTAPLAVAGYGWGISDQAWAGGKTLSHAGSNGMNFCVCWLAPRKGFGVLVCTNQGDELKACNEAASALINRYLTETDAR